LPPALTRRSRRRSRAASPARRFHVVEQQQDAADLRVGRGRVEGGQHVAQLGLALAIGQRLQHREPGRRAGALLDDWSGQIEHEGGVRRQRRPALVEPGGDDRGDDGQEQHIQDQRAQETDRVPDEAEEPANQTGARRHG
jgi:hypothetical protein